MIFRYPTKKSKPKIWRCKLKNVTLHPLIKQSEKVIHCDCKTTSIAFPLLERWQSGRMHRSWKPAYWEVPGVRIPLSPQCSDAFKWLLFTASTASQTPYGEMAEWSNAPVLKTGVLRGTGGSNPSLSAKESCKSKDLQDFLFLCFGSPPFWGSKNFCLPLYKVVSYQLNFGIKQINSLLSAEFILPTRHDSPHSYTFSLFHGDNSN